MNNSTPRWIAFAAVAVLSVSASASGDEALSEAFRTMWTKVAATAQLKSKPQALVFMTTAAGAGAVTLVCRANSGDSFVLRVDYDRNIVDMPNTADVAFPIGTAFYSTRATISAGAITWDTVIKSRNATFKGSLDRTTAQAWVMFSEFSADGRQHDRSLSSSCRPATPIF